MALSPGTVHVTLATRVMRSRKPALTVSASDYLVKVCRPIDHLAIQQRHQALHVLNLRRGDVVKIAVPEGYFGAFPRLERPDLVFQEHLACAPSRITARRRLPID